MVYCTQLFIQALLSALRADDQHRHHTARGPSRDSSSMCAFVADHLLSLLAAKPCFVVIFGDYVCTMPCPFH